MRIINRAQKKTYSIISKKIKRAKKQKKIVELGSSEVHYDGEIKKKYIPTNTNQYPHGLKENMYSNLRIQTIPLCDPEFEKLKPGTYMGGFTESDLERL